MMRLSSNPYNRFDTHNLTDYIEDEKNLVDKIADYDDNVKISDVINNRLSSNASK